MRLMIIGTLNGQLTTATKIAMDRGAQVTHAPSIDTAMADLRAGRGADLVMVEVSNDIADLMQRLEAEHIHVPVVACGVDNDAKAAVIAECAIAEKPEAAGAIKVALKEVFEGAKAGTSGKR